MSVQPRALTRRIAISDYCTLITTITLSLGFSAVLARVREHAPSPILVCQLWSHCFLHVALYLSFNEGDGDLWC